MHFPGESEAKAGMADDRQHMKKFPSAFLPTLDEHYFLC
jgi:hypothetical protein